MPYNNPEERVLAINNPILRTLLLSDEVKVILNQIWSDAQSALKLTYPNPSYSQEEVDRIVAAKMEEIKTLITNERDLLLDPIKRLVEYNQFEKAEKLKDIERMSRISAYENSLSFLK